MPTNAFSPGRIPAFLFLAVSVIMTICVVVTSFHSNILEALPVLNQQPWFTATIIDFYFNILILSVWVFYREPRRIRALAWVVGFVCLGSIVTAFYVFLQLARLKDGEPLMNAIIRKDSRE